jgi:hypothetical protein
LLIVVSWRTRLSDQSSYQQRHCCGVSRKLMFDQFERQFWSGGPELTGCAGRIICEPEASSMDATRSDFMQRLLFWSTVIVLWHSVAVVWHLYLVLRLRITFPRLVIPSLMNVLPVSCLASLLDDLVQISLPLRPSRPPSRTTIANRRTSAPSSPRAVSNPTSTCPTEVHQLRLQVAQPRLRPSVKQKPGCR